MIRCGGGGVTKGRVSVRVASVVVHPHVGSHWTIIDTRYKCYYGNMIREEM